MQFSNDQNRALYLYKAGHNLVITGPGGTGKSKWIQYVATDPGVQVCAMTGCAAILLECNAKTVHSWAGIGIDDASKAIRNEHVKLRWKNTRVLIIDEISMMSDTLFDLLNKVGQTIRSSCLPFGGIQLVFCGDFYQLPPVRSNFCFESPQWDVAFKHTIEFTTVFRQKNTVYQEILHEVRKGHLSESNRLLIEERITQGEGVKLVPTRAKADHINTIEYTKLTTEEKEYSMKFSSSNEYEKDYLRKNSRCDESIKLKVGTKVMCIVNLDVVCNGSQGIVVSIDEYPIVKFSHGNVCIRPHVWSYGSTIMTQLPLIYAWGITIHKAQGATLETACIDLGNDVFEYGQTYVALSRVVDLSGLYLTSFNPHKIRVHPKVEKYYTSIKE